MQKPDVEKKMLEILAFWASTRRMEPRIGENCKARRDECNGGNENARNSNEILVIFLQRQVFAKSVPRRRQWQQKWRGARTPGRTVGGDAGENLEGL